VSFIFFQKNDHTGRESVRGNGRSAGDYSVGTKKKIYIFLAKEIADKSWNNSGFSPFYPTIPPSASYFCFMDLAVIVGLHTKVWFISIRLSLLF
jgi:hypothetical protein